MCFETEMTKREEGKVLTASRLVKWLSKDSKTREGSEKKKKKKK